MRYGSGMLPGEPEPPRETVTMTRFVGVRAGRGGLLHTVVQLGAHVRPGRGLGTCIASTVMS